MALRIGDTGIGGLLHLFGVLSRRERLGELHRGLRIEVLARSHGHQLLGRHPRLLVEGFLLQALHLALVIQIHLLVLAVELLDLAQAFDLGIHLGIVQFYLRLAVCPLQLALPGAAFVGILVLALAMRERQLLQLLSLIHISTDGQVYARPYFNIDGQVFYILDDVPRAASYNICNFTIPGERPLSLAMPAPPLFAQKMCIRDSLKDCTCEKRKQASSSR